MRQCCGELGYLAVAGLSRLHMDMGVGVVTGEGDNTVML